MKKEKIFYLHIPKTAGSSLNKFFVSQFDENKSLTHIESTNIFTSESSLLKAKEHEFLSGHVVFPLAQKKLNILQERISMATFRHPLKHIESHINWVRKLGNIEEEERLSKHSLQIQKIVKKLINTDLSNATSLSNFIEWLEKEKLFLFHDVQTRYLCGSPQHSINSSFLNIAMQNIEKIDYVGITERLDEFVAMCSYKFNWPVPKDRIEKENQNNCNYGLDIHNESTRKILQKLIMNDQIIYRLARERFITQWHQILILIEKDAWYGYSTVSMVKIKNEMERKSNV